MSSPETEWWRVRAGEYVLGTLDAKARELFERTLRADPELQREVRGWEWRLAPLDEATPSREPSPGLWPAIARRVRAEAGGADTAAPTAWPDETRAAASVADGARATTPAPVTPSPVVPFPAPAPAVDERAPPRRGLLLPFVAAFATAAALVMGVLLNEQSRRFDNLLLQAGGVSVILGEDGAPLWLVQADFDEERVRVTALRPPPAESGGDYQLWQVLPDGAGVSPVALLPTRDGDSRESAVSGLADRFDAFAVSFEPDGGSPEPVPTGPVLFQGEVFYTRDGSETD